jgi:hypothetical protein
LPASAGATEGIFAEHRIAVTGREAGYLEAGAGGPLLVLAGDGPRPSVALELLAARHRVIALG